VPNLEVSEIVCAGSVLKEGQPRLTCEVLPINKGRTGSMLTVPTALFTPQEKLSAQASGALAVEMEAYPMAAWAIQRRIPFYHARVILDTWDEALPDLNGAINNNGQVNLIPFLKLLVQRPGLFRELWWLTSRIRSVNPALENLAREIARDF
jgi:nucleoside phosphorylase